MNPWKPRRQAVGTDIHGKCKELEAIYQQLLDNAFDPHLDQFIITGDLVDVGEDTKGVIQWCIDKEKKFNTPQEKHFVFLKGNHEDLLLDALDPKHSIYDDPDLWIDQGGKETIKSYHPRLKNINGEIFAKSNKKPEYYITKEHLEWLKKLPLIMVGEDYVFVHGGLPNEPLEIILDKLNKADSKTIYTLLWIRNEFIYSNFDWGKRIIYGHTGCLNGEPLVQHNKIGLNTMPRNEGKLSFLEIPSMRFYFQPKL